MKGGALSLKSSRRNARTALIYRTQLIDLSGHSTFLSALVVSLFFCDSVLFLKRLLMAGISKQMNNRLHFHKLYVFTTQVSNTEVDVRRVCCLLSAVWPIKAFKIIKMIFFSQLFLNNPNPPSCIGKKGLRFQFSVFRFLLAVSI